MNPENRSYDVTTGISTAAINAAGLSMFPPGQELDAAIFLKKTWLAIDQKNIFVDWPLGIINGVLFQKGFFNNEPYFDYINSFLKNAVFKRKFSIGVVNANDGVYHTFNESTPLKELNNFFVASAAIAGFFPYVVIGNDTFIDGSTLFSVDLFTAIQRCLAITGNIQQDIIIDAVFTEKQESMEKNMTGAHTIAMLMRYFQINGFLVSTYYIQDVLRHFPDVHFRYLLTPKAKLPSGGIYGIDYNPKDIELIIDQGEKETTDYIKTHLQTDWNSEIRERINYIKNLKYKNKI